MSDCENLKTGDRVRHADGSESHVGVIEAFHAYPLVTVRWESTGRTSTENLYLLIRK